MVGANGGQFYELSTRSPYGSGKAESRNSTYTILMSAIETPHDSSTATENTTDAEAADTQEATTGLGLFEAYSTLTDLLTVVRRINNYNDVPDDDPNASYQDALEDFVYRGEQVEDLGDMVGEHPLRKAEVFQQAGTEDQIQDFEVLDTVPLSVADEAWFDYLQENDIIGDDEDFHLPVVEGARLPIAVDSDDAFQTASEAVATLYVNAIEDRTSIEGVEVESESEDEPAIENPHKQNTGVEDSEGSDLTQREAVLQVLRGADAELQAAVEDSERGYRQKVISRVEDAFGISPSPNNISKICSDWESGEAEAESEDVASNVSKEELMEVAAAAATEAVNEVLDA